MVSAEHSPFFCSCGQLNFLRFSKESVGPANKKLLVDKIRLTFPINKSTCHSIYADNGLTHIAAHIPAQSGTQVGLAKHATQQAVQPGAAPSPTSCA